MNNVNITNKIALLLTLINVNGGVLAFTFMIFRKNTPIIWLIVTLLLAVMSDIFMIKEYRTNKASRKLMYMIGVVLQLYCVIVVIGMRMDYLYMLGYLVSMIGFIYIDKINKRKSLNIIGKCSKIKMCLYMKV